MFFVRSSVHGCSSVYLTSNSLLSGFFKPCQKNYTILISSFFGFFMNSFAKVIGFFPASRSLHTSGTARRGPRQRLIEMWGDSKRPKEIWVFHVCDVCFFSFCIFSCFSFWHLLVVTVVGRVDGCLKDFWSLVSFLVSFRFLGDGQDDGCFWGILRWLDWFFKAMLFCLHSVLLSSPGTV